MPYYCFDKLGNLILVSDKPSPDPKVKSFFFDTKVPPEFVRFNGTGIVVDFESVEQHKREMEEVEKLLKEKKPEMDEKHKGIKKISLPKVP